MMKRSKQRRASMSSKDEGYSGGPWLWSPYGNDNRKRRRIDRARRKRAAQREMNDG